MKVDGYGEKQDIDYTLQSYFNIFSQGFILILLSELGDKSQISTIYLSATVKPIHVFIASILAQYILSALAVFFGNFISDKISERNLTLFAGVMFIIFAVITLYYTLPFQGKEIIANNQSHSHSSNIFSGNSTKSLNKLKKFIQTDKIEITRKLLNKTITNYTK